jgi:hypothetical protein
MDCTIKRKKERNWFCTDRRINENQIEWLLLVLIVEHFKELFATHGMTPWSMGSLGNSSQEGKIISAVAEESRMMEDNSRGTWKTIRNTWGSDRV